MQQLCPGLAVILILAMASAVVSSSLPEPAKQPEGGEVLNFTISRTWDNKVAEDRAEIHISLSRGRKNEGGHNNGDTEELNVTETKGCGGGGSSSSNSTTTCGDEEEGLVIHVDAPFYDDPRVPPQVSVGSVDGLWDFEVVELFFLGVDNKYLEIELAPRGHYLLLLLKAPPRPSPNPTSNTSQAVDGGNNRTKNDDPHHPGASGDDDDDEASDRWGEQRETLENQLPLSSFTTNILQNPNNNNNNQSNNNDKDKDASSRPRWTGRAFIPKNYLPTPITRFNAYAIHKSDPNRVYMSLYPTPTGKFQNPNFHRLKYFQPIDLTKLLIN